MKTEKEIMAQCEEAMIALLESKNLDVKESAYIQGWVNALNWVLERMWVY